MLSGCWTAIVLSSAATLLAGTVATMLAKYGRATSRAGKLIGAWAVLLVAGYLDAGRTGRGTLLTAASIVQVTPSIWTANRTERPTGISAETWMLVFGELVCWTAFGLYRSDPRLISLGATGITASIFMLDRIWRTGHRGRNSPTPSAATAPGRSSNPITNTPES